MDEIAPVLASSRSSVARLRVEIRQRIEKHLAEGRMTLDELIADLQSEFPDEAKAGELPSRSAVGRYGQKLEKRLAAIRASTEAAKIIREHTADREDARSEALTSMIQTGLFDSLMMLQEADDEDIDISERIGLLSEAAKNIATLTRSSVTLKKYQEDIEARARKQALEDAAASAEQAAKSQGLSSDGVAALRAAIMEGMQ